MSKSTQAAKKAEQDVGLLLARIDEQNEQLTRYQSKFRGSLHFNTYFCQILSILNNI
jgi:hypothetical protein